MFNIGYGICSAIFGILMMVCVIMMYNTCRDVEMFSSWYVSGRAIAATWVVFTISLIIRTLFKKYGICKWLDFDSFGPIVMLMTTISLTLWIMTHIIINAAGFR